MNVLGIFVNIVLFILLVVLIFNLVGASRDIRIARKEKYKILNAKKADNVLMERDKNGNK